MLFYQPGHHRVRAVCEDCLAQGGHQNRVTIDMAQVLLAIQAVYGEHTGVLAGLDMSGFK